MPKLIELVFGVRVTTSDSCFVLHTWESGAADEIEYLPGGGELDLENSRPADLYVVVTYLQV